MHLSKKCCKCGDWVDNTSHYAKIKTGKYYCVKCMQGQDKSEFYRGGNSACD